MTAYEIITKKRDGGNLAKEEIDYFVHGYVAGRIPDYQMAALLMAIFLRGMNADETAWLTESMWRSGEALDFQDIEGPKVDKHSTGGVGDKVSLILAPLVAAAGVKVPMISGRSLAHSGGTLDKLEAIPGFRTNLSVAELRDQLRAIGVFIAGQTGRLVPADRKIYALRDATGTIETIPLVTASILSKKLAEGIDALVLDVKVGKGAFFQDRERAKELAHDLVTTAEKNGLRAVALLTNMDQPLGSMVGNWLETKEAILCLRGEGPDDLTQVTRALGALMLELAGRCKSVEEGQRQLEELISDGSAYERFLRMVEWQGGDLSVVEDPDTAAHSSFSKDVLSVRDGFVSGLNAHTIGNTVVRLGGGRQIMEDSIDHAAGIALHKKIGDPVKRGEVLATIFTEKEPVLDAAAESVASAFSVSDDPPEAPSLFYKIIDAGGEQPWASSAHPE